MYKVRYKKDKALYFNNGKVYGTKEEIHDALLKHYAGRSKVIDTLSMEEILEITDMDLVIANPVECKSTFKPDGDLLEIYVNGHFLGTTHISQMSPEVRKEIFNG